jgi:hypothetical protein
MTAQTRLTPLWKTNLGRFGSILANVAVALGIVTGYLALVPKVSVVQTLPLNPIDPFSTPFIVSNEGPFGINGIEIVCHLKYVESEHAHFNDFNVWAYGLNQQLDPGQRDSADCIFSDVFGLPHGDIVTTADITMKARFRPDFLPWKQNRYFRFVAQKGSDGHLYWFPKAMSSEDREELEGPGASFGVKRQKPK